MEACRVCSERCWELFCKVPDRLRGITDRIWEVQRCQNCGLGVTFPLPREADLLDIYPSGYWGDVRRTVDEYCSGELLRTRSWRKETEKVRLVEQFVTGGRILDVGCADGKFLWALDGNRWERTGVEPTPKIVDIVRARIPQVRLLTLDIFSPELPAEGFDAISFWHVLEHLHEPKKVIRRVVDLLRPGAWLFVSVPNLNSLQAAVFRSHWYAFDDVPRHLFHFSPNSLRLLLQSAGLNVRKLFSFSRMINFHCLKYSLINWSEARFRSRFPYYLLKPFLFGFASLERVVNRHGIITMVAQKPGSSSEQ